MALGKQKLSNASWNSSQAHVISCWKLIHLIKKTTQNFIKINKIIYVFFFTFALLFSFFFSFCHFAFFSLELWLVWLSKNYIYFKIYCSSAIDFPMCNYDS